MKISSSKSYISEISFMPYVWFFKQFIFKILSLRYVSLSKNKKINSIFNLMLFPFLLISSPLLSFLKMQHFEDLAMKHNYKINFLYFGEIPIKHYRIKNGDLNYKEIMSKHFL